MRITILLPTYNDGSRTAFIRQAVRSITTQTDPEWDCLVSDNCSPVAFEDVTRDLLDSRFTVVRQKRNLGLFGNWNYLFGACDADAIAFLADDDWWQPNIVATLRRAMIAHPDVPLAVCATRFVHPDGRSEAFRPPFLHLLPDGVGPEGQRISPQLACASHLFGHVVHASAMLVRTGSMRAALPFVSDFPFADAIAWAKVCARGGVVYVPYEGLMYRFHPGAASASGWVGEASNAAMGAAVLRVMEEAGVLSVQDIVAVSGNQPFHAWYDAFRALHLWRTPVSNEVAAEVLCAFRAQAGRVRVASIGNALHRTGLWVSGRDHFKGADQALRGIASWKRALSRLLN